MDSKLRAVCRYCGKKRYKSNMVDLGGTWLCKVDIRYLYLVYVQDHGQNK